MSLPKFTLYTRSQYFDDLLKRVADSKKGDKIIMMTMRFDPRMAVIDALTTAFCQAASRGVHVSLTVDAECLMQADGALPGPLLTGTSATVASRKPYGTILQRLEQLRLSGGEYHIVNKPKHGFSSPYAGRSHIKFALINDRIYIPSCNLDHDDFLDLAVAWEDPKTAAWLRNLHHKIINTGNVRQALKDTDQVHTVSDNVSLFVDSGVKRQSLIYQHALDLMNTAEKQLYMTCQYFPGERTGQTLYHALKRGVDVIVKYSPPSVHGKKQLAMIIYNQREALRLPPQLFIGRLPRSAPTLHAKLLASEQAALLGSHNFVPAGVNWGTAEIALLVRDPAFAKAARAKIEAEIARVSAK
jgi:cardiolipin synthase